jgi:CubicO group peptidase (beta-lactamase class C family)
MLRAYREWHAKNKFKHSSIAIFRDGRVVAMDSVGGTSPTKPEFVASVSKSITGLCIVKLVEQGRLRYEDDLGTLLSGYFARYGQPADARMRNVKVSHLLHHSGGVDGGNSIPQKTPLAEQAQKTFSLPLKSSPGAEYSYQNTNYQLLGLIIETVTGQRYEDACRRLVLLPAGATSAHVSRLQPYTSSWAGWVISAREYALVMRHFDPRYGLLRTGPRDWPKFNKGNRWFEGPGVHMRHNEDGTYSLLHSGAWTWNSAKLKLSYLARFVHWGSRIGFAMNASPLTGTGEDLESALWQASQPQPGDPPVGAAPPPRQQQEPARAVSAAPAEVEPDTDRPGGDYRSFEMLKPDIALCRRSCALDTRCRAYAFVRGGTRSANAKCWLKSEVPPARADTCCTSGVMR